MDHSDIREVLRRTHVVLDDIRKAFAAGGHTEALQELDSLIGVAAQETRRKLVAIENRR